MLKFGIRYLIAIYGSWKYPEIHPNKYIFFPKKKRIRVSTFFSGRLCSGKETISKLWTNTFATY